MKQLIRNYIKNIVVVLVFISGTAIFLGGVQT